MPDNIRERLSINGAMILETQPGGSAYQAGLKTTYTTYYGDIYYGDVIIGIDGNPVTENDDLANYLDTKKPGDKVEIEISRKKKKSKVILALQEI